jgi:hypothetical protein
MVGQQRGSHHFGRCLSSELEEEYPAPETLIEESHMFAKGLIFQKFDGDWLWC